MASNTTDSDVLSDRTGEQWLFDIDFLFDLIIQSAGPPN